jgi:hypothetical protein
LRFGYVLEQGNKQFVLFPWSDKFCPWSDKSVHAPHCKEIWIHSHVGLIIWIFYLLSVPVRCTPKIKCLFQNLAEIYNVHVGVHDFLKLKSTIIFEIFKTGHQDFATTHTSWKVSKQLSTFLLLFGYFLDGCMYGTHLIFWKGQVQISCSGSYLTRKYERNRLTEVDVANGNTNLRTISNGSKSVHS